MADVTKTFTFTVDVTKLDAKLRHATSGQKTYVAELLLSAMSNPAKAATILAAESGTVAKDYGVSLASVA